MAAARQGTGSAIQDTSEALVLESEALRGTADVADDRASDLAKPNYKVE